MTQLVDNDVFARTDRLRSNPLRTLPAALGLLAFAAASAAWSSPAPADGARPSGADGAAVTLHALLDEEWERDMRESPTWASSLGDRRYDDRWSDMRLEALAESHAADLETLQRLSAIDRTALPAGERINYDLFERRYRDRVDGYRFRTFLAPVSHRGGIQTRHEFTEQLRMETVRDFESWIARLRALGDHVDQYVALMRRGMAEGRLPPRILMDRVSEQLEAQLVDTPEESPFFDVFETRPPEIPEDEWQRLARDGRSAIEAVVLPAYRRFASFFGDSYLPACRETIGVWDLPDGLDYYAYRARRMTTTDLTPDEIHQIGIEEVARIRREMEAVIERVEFGGTFAEFLDFLRSDPQFYHDDPEELLEHYRATCKRIDPGIVKLFGNLPRMPYGVEPIPEISAPHTTTAYYSRPAADGSRAGTYYVNLYRPEVRPTYEIEVLSVHEAVPGHHLQISLAMELGELPEFRRYTGYTTFVEGWGLYSESLGDDLGLYQDPYSKFGQLTYEMWRAVRLVVDTGLHYFKWDRQRAIDYFAANTAKTQHDIVNEIDRYIGTPAQALAYKIGELRIQELRRRAESRLGDAFDVRAFHDVVLGSGAVPLDVLEDNVEAYLASAAPGSAGSGQ